MCVCAKTRCPYRKTLWLYHNDISDDVNFNILNYTVKNIFFKVVNKTKIIGVCFTCLFASKLYLFQSVSCCFIVIHLKCTRKFWVKIVSIASKLK